MRPALVLVLAAVGLAGCVDEHAPRWVSVCTRSHIETSTQLMVGNMGAAYGGLPIGGGMHLVQQHDTVCDASEIRCDHGGRDFKGDRACPVPPAGQP